MRLAKCLERRSSLPLLKLINEGTSRNEVARILDINPSTLYRNLQKIA